MHLHVGQDHVAWRQHVVVQLQAELAGEVGIGWEMYEEVERFWERL